MINSRVLLLYWKFSLCLEYLSNHYNKIVSSTKKKDCDLWALHTHTHTQLSRNRQVGGKWHRFRLRPTTSGNLWTIAYNSCNH